MTETDRSLAEDPRTIIRGGIESRGGNAPMAKLPQVTRFNFGETSRFTVQVVADWRDLEPLRPQWVELAENALEPSPFAENWMLIPALRYGLPGDAARVALVFASDTAFPSHDAVLCGVFPIEEKARFRGLPTRVVRIWSHIYSVGSDPLVRQECAPACIRAFIDWARAEQPAQTLIHFPELRVDSKFFELLIETLRQDGRNYSIVDVWKRAMFQPKADAQQYIQSIGTAHHRHEWRRQERRLSEKGAITFDSLDSVENVQPWLDEFIALEMRGWKGKQGTAFGCGAGHRAWLVDVVRDAFERRRLMMLALRLDDKAIAMRLSFLAHPGSFAFKIAFDESLLKFSPGVLLELENIRRLHTMPEIEWMDSLAAPNHPLMDRVWKGRAAFVSLLVAPGPWLGQILLASIPLLQTLKRLCARRPQDADVHPQQRSD